MEEIIIVDKDDTVIGKKLRKDVTDEICRVTGLWVTDPEGNVLLARRSPTKQNFPNLWSAAAGGAVAAGETYEQNIIREVQEEIGITGYAFEKSVKQFLDVPGVRCFVQWFKLTIPRELPLVLDPEEVAEVKWFTKAEISKMYTENPDQFIGGKGTYLFLDEV